MVNLSRKMTRGSFLAQFKYDTPFLISAVAIDRFLIFFSKIKTKLLLIEKISGFLFIGFGIVLLTGTMTLLNNIFNQ